MKRRDLALIGLFVLVTAYALKRHYSSASAEALLWVLAPSAALTELVLQREFVWQSAAGYFSPDLSIVIAKSCAGVNFLVIAFVTLALGFVARFESLRARLLWVCTALLVAYLSTLVANTARIALSVTCSHAAARWLDWSFQAAHRAIGVAVYLIALLALVWVCRRALHSGGSRRLFPLGLALATYVGLTLVVPALRGAGSSPAYREHALAVALGALAALAVALLSTAPHLFRGLRASASCPGRGHAVRSR